VLATLASGLGRDGVGVVAHDAKELMRTLLPLGVDITGLAMDTAVAAYLLDPSDDRYRLSDLAPRYLGVSVDDGTGAKGQGAFLLEEAGDEGDGTDTSGLDHTGRAGPPA
jgi:DNA polymerase-1